jgi:hypothetical protein
VSSRPTPLATPAPSKRGSPVAPPHAPEPPAYAPSGRRWGPILAAFLLMVCAVAVAAVLITRSDSTSLSTAHDGDGGTTIAVGPVTISSAKPFDPFGDNNEDDEDAPKTFDGNAATFWHTEYYQDRKFSSSPTKKGVGLILSTDRVAKLGQLTVSSPTQDWAAQVYVSDTTHETLAEWGDPVATKANVKGAGTFDLQGRPGKFVLLWITDLGSGPPAPGATGPPNVTVLVTEVAITAV